MANLNKVIMIGNLTRDPELRFTPNGVAVASFGLAVNRRWVNKQGERAESTDFFTVVVWGKLADICAEHLRKGSPVAIDGRLQSRSWETSEGQKRSTVEIVANDVQFLGRPSGKKEGIGDLEVVSEEPVEEVTEEISNGDIGNEVPF